MKAPAPTIIAMIALLSFGLASQSCREQSSSGKPTPVVCTADGNCPPVEKNQEQPLPIPPPKPKPVPVPVEKISFSFAKLSPEKAQTLGDKAQGWAQFGATCPSGYPAKPSTDQPCDDGDSVIFNGLLCYSGNEVACKAVGESQTSDGRWWRSPRRAAGEGRVSAASFSRDQLIGVIFYLMTLYKTEPEQAQKKATAWHNWIKANGDSLCTDAPTTCRVAPANWTLLARLFDFMKLPLDNNLQNYLGTESNKIVLTVIQLFTEPGFQLHNYAATALAFAEMGFAETMVPWLKAVKKVKGMEDNPFIELTGKLVCAGTCNSKTTLDSWSLDAIADKVLSQCPDVATTASNRSQWGWERKNSEKAWENSMGWDCVFMANYLARVSARSEPPAEPAGGAGP